MDSPITIVASASTQTSLYSNTLPSKRKRRPAGTPDPDAEVIALSPHTLMESDSYVCEICNQGFQRDQNLQMHRRRHKVPWKLLKRVEPEVRKRVYVCPEPSCLHHDPCHALGDMVGIKKHYRRKHSSMKQWECYKCSKAYAVQSDYKAHLKTCGTKGHCCDCGRVFSRIESFIEHQDTCTAPRRNKSQNASRELEAASLHIVGDGENRSGILFDPLPLQISPPPASPASVSTMKARASIAIPAVAPLPPLSPASPASLCQRSSHHITINSTHSTQDESFWWQREQPCISFHKSCDLQHDRVLELQLLPTSRAHLSDQVDSSQSSIIPTSSGTTAREPAADKCTRDGVDYLEMLPLSGATSTDAAAPGAVVCKLQLSIGMSNSDENTNNGKSKSVPTLVVDADCLQTEQSDSSSGSIKDPHESVMSKLILSERASCVSQKLSFLLNPEHMKVPAAEKAEVLLQEANEKLRRASAEKLEAQKAWREAKREREQAEQDLAKAQRIAEYNGRVAKAGKLGADLQLALQQQNKGGGLRVPACSSSTSSSPCSSITNSQSTTNSLQSRQVHAGGMVLPTCITCPTCLHTQILYPSPATTSMGTLFL